MESFTDPIYSIILAVLTGEATEEERRRLQNWLSESEAHRREFGEMEKLYRLANVSPRKDHRQYDVEKAWQKVRRQTIAKKQRSIVRQWMGYAAMIALVCLAAYFIGQPSSEPAKPSHMAYERPTLLLDNGTTIDLREDSFSISTGKATIHNNLQNQLCYRSDEKTADNEPVRWNHLIIPKGNAYELTLSDGTHIWLNAESELSYPTTFQGGEREVKLKGEAYFEVAKNPDKPFRVKTGGLDVEVLGTSFNVSAYDNEANICVTLAEGAVAVQTGKGEEFRISPSEQLTYHRESRQSDIRTVQTQMFTSWTRGEYIFKDATLDEILTKLSHWYDFRVQYEDQRLKDKRFSCTVDRSISLQQLLELLSYTSDVKLKRTGDQITISVEPTSKEVE
ncbi:hypothetical protein B5F34_00380 [Mediterranea sp. An20]|uniref:FecR family protein n=1 Tax=Mediterranea sp. An20 TaxID=1965586 RepID=UPI000B36C12E|nr:FecR domain-containing protein [Mediterranea sp. An20]OUP12101.1 hypothetical protein B5F34_00380 [Mediterranea sp. An20]